MKQLNLDITLEDVDECNDFVEEMVKRKDKVETGGQGYRRVSEKRLLKPSKFQNVACYQDNILKQKLTLQVAKGIDAEMLADFKVFLDLTPNFEQAIKTSLKRTFCKQLIWQLETKIKANPHPSDKLDLANELFVQDNDIQKVEILVGEECPYSEETRAKQKLLLGKVNYKLGRYHKALDCLEVAGTFDTPD